MHNLKEKLINNIKEFIDLNKPILGICVGMQILFNNLLEGDGGEGLRYFNSDVRPIYSDKKSNIGWRNVSKKKSSILNFWTKIIIFVTPIWLTFCQRKKNML